MKLAPRVDPGKLVQKRGQPFVHFTAATTCNERPNVIWTFLGD